MLAATFLLTAFLDYSPFLNMEVVPSSETSAKFYHTANHHIRHGRAGTSVVEKNNVRIFKRDFAFLSNVPFVAQLPTDLLIINDVYPNKHMCYCSNAVPIAAWEVSLVNLI